MKRTLTIIALVLMARIAVFAQEQQQGPAETFTLDKAIEYALQNGINIQNSTIDEQIANARVRETVGTGLPQINGSAGLTYNSQLPRFFAMKQTAYGFSGASKEGSPGYVPYDQFLPGLKDNDVLASQNFFQLKGSGNATLSVSQLLFSGTYIVGLQAAKTFKELSTRTTRQTKEQTIEMVTKAFYSALINRERSKLFDSNIGRVDSLLRNTKALNSNGFAESIDVDRIQVSFNNLVTERDKFLKLQELSLELLKFQMNYPMEKNIDVSGQITRDLVEVNWDGYLADWDYKKRSDYRLLETNRALQHLTLKSRYASLMPTISANANIGYMTQSGTIGGFFKTNSNVPAEFVSQGIGPDKWYPISSYGVSLNLPIFSGFQRTYQIQQERLRLQKLDNSFRITKASIDLQVKQSTIMYQNAISSLDTQQRNMELASKVARVTRIKYEQGVGSNLEVIEAEASLKESQVNYFNALYDALVAKTDLDKAFAKLVPITADSETK
jgi:outer membrane protein TolC